MHDEDDDCNERYSCAIGVTQGSSPVVVYALDPAPLLSPRPVTMMMMLMIDGAAILDELGTGKMCCVSVGACAR